MTAINANRAIRGPVTSVPVVAGHGVRIVPDTVNNRFVVEADETVIFDGNGTAVSSATLSETPFNFEKIKLVIAENNSAYNPEEKTIVMHPGATWFNLNFITGQVNMYSANIRYTVTSTTITADKVLDVKGHYDNATSFTFEHNTSLLTNIYKIVGVNRIAST